MAEIIPLFLAIVVAQLKAIFGCRNTVSLVSISGKKKIQIKTLGMGCSRQSPAPSSINEAKMAEEKTVSRTCYCDHGLESALPSTASS